MKSSDLLTIGDLARRTGLSVPTIRFYEEKGLVEPLRTGGNQRRFLRADIRRVSFILIAQKLGLSLAEIGEAMAAKRDETVEYFVAGFRQMLQGNLDAYAKNFDSYMKPQG